MKMMYKPVFVLLALSIFLAGCAAKNDSSPQPSESTQEASYFEPLSALDIPDEATLVAFGEATHGNHEFKALATDVFKRLVLEEGFRAFAIEAHFGNCMAINEYILYGTGTAEEAVHGNGFWVHDFQEVVDLVEWMREYNLTAAEGDKLRFYGFDIQEVDVSKERYLAYMQTVDAEKAEQDEIALENLTNLEVYQGSKYTLNEILKNVNKMLDEARQNEKNYVNVSSKSDFDFALRNLLCIRNTIEFGLIISSNDVSESVRFSNSFVYRDRCMFENVRWIIEQEESLGRGKVFIFGHNGHISTSEYYTYRVMGQHLSTEYGDRYFAIGTDYYQNTFIAVRTGEGVAENTVTHDSGELINAFISENVEIGILNIIKHIEGGDMAAVLNSYQNMGSVGAVFDNMLPANTYTIDTIPANSYDAIIFVRNATPATFIK